MARMVTTVMAITTTAIMATIMGITATMGIPVADCTCTADNSMGLVCECAPALYLDMHYRHPQNTIGPKGV